MDEPLEITLRSETRTHSNYCDLYRKIKSYSRTGKFTDMTLTSSKGERDTPLREFKCHRLILAAASEYFEGMFRGDWCEEHNSTINYLDLDDVTLELFRKFAYRGVIILDDENVFGALRISDRFGVPYLEHLCIRYLTERKIPTNCAIELFAFACAANKKSLIPPLRDFILNHLPELWEDADENIVLLKMSLDDWEHLLTDRKPLSREGEGVLWKILVHWVSENYPRQSSVLKKLVPICKFNFFHPKLDFIMRFIVEKDYAIDNFASCPVGNTSEALLHMYVTEDENTYNLITMDANYNRPVEVPLGKQCEIKTVTIGNHLYLYAWQLRGNCHVSTFSVYSSVRLTDEQTLKSPTGKRLPPCRFEADFMNLRKTNFYHANISGDPVYKRIFLRQNFEPFTKKELFWYDCASDRWSFINYRRKEVDVVNVTYFDHRLYTVGWSKTVQAYDPRAGSWQNLCSSLLPHCGRDRFCSHKGKLYVTCERKRVNRYGSCYVTSEVYDPAAGRWRVVSPTSFPQDEFTRARWLLSLENRLWMFRENDYFSDTTEAFRYRFQIFDSLLEKWSQCRRVFSSLADLSLIKDIVVARFE